MKASAVIQAGVCGFRTQVSAVSEDEQNVSFRIETDCEKVRGLARALEAAGPVDAYQEMKHGADGVVLTNSRNFQKGCCAACAVPCGIFKAMQVAAGLNLPRDIEIRIVREVA